MSPELGVPAVNRTDVIKPFEQEPTAAEQVRRSAALWLPWATASPITRTATQGRAWYARPAQSMCIFPTSVTVPVPEKTTGSSISCSSVNVPVPFSTT
jgi:hypothetical protein